MPDATVDVVIVMLTFGLSIFWTILAVDSTKIVSSAIAAVCWFAVGGEIVLLSSLATYIGAWIGLSWLFIGLGFVFVTVTIFEAIRSLVPDEREREMTIF